MLHKAADDKMTGTAGREGIKIHVPKEGLQMLGNRIVTSMSFVLFHFTVHTRCSFQNLLARHRSVHSRISKSATVRPFLSILTFSLLERRVKNEKRWPWRSWVKPALTSLRQGSFQHGHSFPFGPCSKLEGPSLESTLGGWQQECPKRPVKAHRYGSRCTALPRKSLRPGDRIPVR